MKTANKIAMAIAGLFLIVAAVMKVHQMLTEAVFSEGLWESWEFFLVAIPLEFGLGVWLVSGIFRKAGWILGVLTYLFFIIITLHKAVTGQTSCGCFGTAEVDPWITLWAIDIPIFLMLIIFWPRGEKLLPPPWPHGFRCLVVAIPACLIMGAMVPTMYFNKIPYEIVEPDKWQVDQPIKTVQNQQQKDPNDIIKPKIDTNETVIDTNEQTDANEPEGIGNPIADNNQDDINIQIPENIDANEADIPQWKQMINNTDITEKLNTNVKIVMFYHYNCPDCAEAIPLYDQYSEQFNADENIQFAFVKGPPYGPDEKDPVPDDTTALVGKLIDEDEKLIFESPLTLLLSDGRLIKFWSVEFPDLDELLGVILTIE